MPDASLFADHLLYHHLLTNPAGLQLLPFRAPIRDPEPAGIANKVALTGPTNPRNIAVNQYWPRGGAITKYSVPAGGHLTLLLRYSGSIRRAALRGYTQATCKVYLALRMLSTKRIVSIDTGDWIMSLKHWLAGAVMCVALSPELSRAAVTEDTFKLQTTADLVALCSDAPSDPMSTAALNFCHGFALGVFRVLDEEAAAQPTHRMFCAQNPGPSRTQAIADFVEWAKTNPNIMSQQPADGLVAYLVKSFPCPRGK